MNDTNTLAAELRQIAPSTAWWNTLDEAADRLEELERDHGKPTDAADPNGSTCARLKWWKDRNDDLHDQLAETAKDYLCLAELLDGHDATECRANLVKMKADLAAKDAHADEIYKAAVDLAAKLEGDLEKERQDRKQADFDTIRALGERNDARAQLTANHEFTKLIGKWLEDERALADRLAASLDIALECFAEGQSIAFDDAVTAEQALASWQQARGKEA
jgi:hypothetical protein